MNFNTLPPIIQQQIESLLDPKTSDNIRFNHSITLENIRDCIDSAIREYNNKQDKKKIRMK